MSTTAIKNPDFIILGAGCAGLSLLMRMIRSGKFAGKRILLIDKALKSRNDRTWCFWEMKDGFFEEIVYNRWSSLGFSSNTFSSPLDIAPYQYKIIRGIDFYNYCFEEIKKQVNIDILYGEIKNITYRDAAVTIDLGDELITANRPIVFNSIYNPAEKRRGKIYLRQHFKGWFIETEKPSFMPAAATLMDFRVHQKAGTTFAYVLPFSETKALVEYTLFTADLLEPEQYNIELKSYISKFLKIDQYKIRDEEFAVIPMTNESFPFYENGMFYIGTAGGQTKASSGYTFQFIQKQSEKIVNWLVADKSLQTMPVTPRRFHFYDSVLLRLLAEKKLGGDEIFSRLFEQNKAALVFKFLDNETSIAEELKLISTLPTIPFLKAAINI